MTPKDGMERMQKISSGYTGQNPMLWLIVAGSLDVKFGVHDSANQLGLRIKYDDGSLKNETFRWDQVEDFGRLSKEEATSLLNGVMKKPSDIYVMLKKITAKD